MIRYFGSSFPPRTSIRFRYEFDATLDGDIRLRRTSYEILQDAARPQSRVVPPHR